MAKELPQISENQKINIFRERTGQDFADAARRANQLKKTRAKLLPHSAFLSFSVYRGAETTVTYPETTYARARSIAYRPADLLGLAATTGSAFDRRLRFGSGAPPGCVLRTASANISRSSAFVFGGSRLMDACQLAMN